MTSQINDTSIDVNFPRTGRDNSAQGFRNNFSSIKNALTIAKSEISNLQSPLVKQMTDENDDNSIDIILDSSNYQVYSIISDTNFTASLSTGLTNHFFKTTVQISNETATPWTISFTGSSYLKCDGTTYLDVDDSIILDPFGKFLIDVWTVDGGSNYFLKVLGVV